jgi:hypothetical protein
MTAWLSELFPADLEEFADLEELKAAIARSPIMVRRLEARLADWARTRTAPDVDEVVLAWLASHSGRAAGRLPS